MFKQFTLACTVLLLLAAPMASTAAPTAIEARWTHPPTGFSVGVLEPMGGRVLVPNGWTLREKHTDSYDWELTPNSPLREPDAKVRIQLDGNIKKRDGVLPSQWVANGVKALKARAVRVVSECSPAPAGLFTRTCVEVEERSPNTGLTHRTNWSFFVNDQAGLLAITTYAGRVDQWATWGPLFDQMQEVEIIDMDKFSKP